jgi:alkylation response protein AidB-like acyl-CoA dehydrogenase
VDFSELQIDEKAKDFWRDVREFIEKNQDPGLLQTQHSTNDVQLQRALGAAGWNVPHWPREQGGADLSALERYILQRELDAHDASLMARQVTLAILPEVEAYGSPELKTEIFPGIAAGEVNFTLGYTEPDSGSDMAAASTRAVRDGDEWVIDGAKMFTSVAHLAKFAFVLARSSPAAQKHRGLTMFLVPLQISGVEIRPIQTVTSERTNLVFFSNVRIPDRYRIGAEGDGWIVASGQLQSDHGVRYDSDPEHLAEITGAGAPYVDDLRNVLNEAVEWASETGRSADPLVRLRIAAAAHDLEVCRNMPGLMGRLTSESLTRVGADFIDMLGPVGVLGKDSPGHIGDGVIEWSHRHAIGTNTYGGTTDIFRNIIAQHVLGLPRPPRPLRET